MVRTQAVIDSWKTVRKDTVLALLDMPDGELGFQPTPDLMPFGNIAKHILNAGHALSTTLVRGVDNLATPDFREKMAALAYPLPAEATAAEIAALLEQSIEADCAELASQPPEFFAGMITRFDGAQVTRLEMLQFIKEHELTHRSQMFMYLRLKGVVPSTTRRRMAKK
jgi:uncharacterized damage-inducible protein DinB